MLALFSPIKCGECAIESLVTAKFRGMIFEKEGKGL